MATKVASQDELDKAVETMHVAEATPARAGGHRRSGEPGARGRENLAYQQERLTFTRIVSPYDGLIVSETGTTQAACVPQLDLAVDFHQ